MVEGKIYAGDLVEFVSEHIPVLNPEEIDKVVDMEYLSLEQVGGCFDGKGGFADPWLSVEEEGVVLVILQIFHEEV